MVKGPSVPVNADVSVMVSMALDFNGRCTLSALQNPFLRASPTCRFLPWYTGIWRVILGQTCSLVQGRRFSTELLVEKMQLSFQELAGDVQDLN